MRTAIDFDSLSSSSAGAPPARLRPPPEGGHRGRHSRWLGTLLALLVWWPQFATAQQLLDFPALQLKGTGRVNAIAVQGDGKIIIAGAFNYVDAAGTERTNIARLNSNGTVDTSFNFKATSTINALAIIGNTLYLGGDFTGVSRVSPAVSFTRNRLAAIDLNTLSITSWDPNVNGEVFALAVSGNTLYAGGSFDLIGATCPFTDPNCYIRIGLASFATAGATPAKPTTWDPSPYDFYAPNNEGIVYSIAPFGSSIYVGGTFTHIGQSTLVQRLNVAAVDAGTGDATAWNVAVDNSGGTVVVRSVIPTASVVYIAGQFAYLGKGGASVLLYTRPGIGAVTTATADVAAFNPGHTPPNGGGTVRALLLDGSTLYAGGEFTGIGGSTRKYAAGLDTTVFSISTINRAGSTATATTPSPHGLSTGDFITIAGANEVEYTDIKQITVTDATHFQFLVPGTPTSPATGTINYSKRSNATAFNPDFDDHVFSLAVSGTNVLVGGEYLKTGSTLNPAFGGFAKSNGARTIAGYVSDNAAVWALVRQTDGKTVVAGDFYLDTGGTLYKNLLRLNANDTLDTGWNPNVDGQIVSAALGPSADNTVLIGGSFSTVGGTARKDIAAVSLTTGLVTAFNANVNSVVNKVLVDGATTYIGGRFTTVGGTGRNYVAAVASTSGALQSWYPAGGVNDFVETLAVDASNVYIGGLFSQVGGQVRVNLAKVSKTTSVVAAWSPVPNEKIFGVTVSGNTVYVAGNFTQLQGANGNFNRNFAGAINATTGDVLGWNPDADFVVLKVVVPPGPPNTVYLAGAFLNVGGVQTGNAAAVDATTGEPQEWYPLLDDAVYDLLPDATRVLLGGVFVDAQFGLPAFGLAGFTKTIGEFLPTFMFWRKTDGTNATWDMTGPVPAQVVAGFPPGVPTSWQAVGLGDVNGDGIVDVVWFQASTGQVATWLMSSPTTIGAATFPASVGSGSGWTLSAVGDMNGDGFADLVWRHTNGELLVWYMNSSGLIGSTKSFGIVPTSYELRGVGDFDGNGVDDVAWFQPSTGATVLYLMTTAKTFTAAFPPGVGASGAWRPYRFGDFDGDGKTDIFWRNTNGQVVAWYMNGGTVAASDFFVSVPFAAWDIGRVDDYDFDGRSDIMWYGNASGSVVRWLFRGRHVAPDVETLQSVGGGWAMVP
ncbi:MAG: FG-GAP-like repeat-containing protein [Casimicrobiaceae bacterium]